MLFSANTILIAFSISGLTSSTPIPTIVDSREATLHRSQHETSLDIQTQRRIVNSKRHQTKRSPDSPLSGVLGTVSSTLGSLPIVGVPLSGLVGTVAGATENLPLLGDLLKGLPLDSLLNGHPVSNLANTLSGVVVALPVVGGPLSGALGSVAGLASSLPISLQDTQRAAVASLQDTQRAAVASLQATQSGAVLAAPQATQRGGFPALQDTQRAAVPSAIGSIPSVASPLPLSAQTTIQTASSVVTPQN